jgi:hypothetical protein
LPARNNQRADLRLVLTDGDSRFACALTSTLRGYDFYCAPGFARGTFLAQSLHQSGLGHTKFAGYAGGRLWHPRGERLDKFRGVKSVWGMSLNAPALLDWSYTLKGDTKTRKSLLVPVDQIGPPISAEVWLGATLKELEQKWEARYDEVRGWIASPWTAPCTAIVVYATHSLPSLGPVISVVRMG